MTLSILPRKSENGKIEESLLFLNSSFGKNLPQKPMLMVVSASSEAKFRAMVEALQTQTIIRLAILRAQKVPKFFI